MSAAMLYAPPEYPVYDGFDNAKVDKADFVHLFVVSKAEFAERFSDASHAVADEGIFWLSYPKSTKKQKYDVNRDSLWDLVIPHGWHPVAQIALDDRWSAIRLKRNDIGKNYERPGAGTKAPG